ncbi:MAG: hypothetical protein IM551_03230 [Chitinophagaceae bacterium]|jgi:uncharacterized membrane protein|nr:hypothetical protein [Chitinophagaceae bacterium]
MAKINLTNVNHRSPKWYRKSKRIIGLLSGPTVMAVFQVFNLTDKQMANVGIIIAFLPTLLEVFSALLANEEYDFNEPKTTE